MLSSLLCPFWAAFGKFTNCGNNCNAWRPNKGLKAGSRANTSAWAGGNPAFISPRAPAPTKSSCDKTAVLIWLYETVFSSSI